jgi:hypothetical protein
MPENMVVGVELKAFDKGLHKSLQETKDDIEDIKKETTEVKKEQSKFLSNVSSGMGSVGSKIVSVAGALEGIDADSSTLRQTLGEAILNSGELGIKMSKSKDVLSAMTGAATKLKETVSKKGIPITPEDQATILGSIVNEIGYINDGSRDTKNILSEQMGTYKDMMLQLRAYGVLSDDQVVGLTEQASSLDMSDKTINKMSSSAVFWGSKIGSTVAILRAMPGILEASNTYQWRLGKSGESWAKTMESSVYYLKASGKLTAANAISLSESVAKSSESFQEQIQNWKYLGEGGDEIMDKLKYATIATGKSGNEMMNVFSEAPDQMMHDLKKMFKDMGGATEGNITRFRAMFEHAGFGEDTGAALKFIEEQGDAQWDNYKKGKVADAEQHKHWDSYMEGFKKTTDYQEIIKKMNVSIYHQMVDWSIETQGINGIYQEISKTVSQLGTDVNSVVASTIVWTDALDFALKNIPMYEEYVRPLIKLGKYSGASGTIMDKVGGAVVKPIRWIPMFGKGLADLIVNKLKGPPAGSTQETQGEVDWNKYFGGNGAGKARVGGKKVPDGTPQSPVSVRIVNPPSSPGLPSPRGKGVK